MKSGELEVVVSFERLTQRIAAHAFMGTEFRYRMGDALIW